MAEILLQAEIREERGKAVRRLRRNGFIPAIIYGTGQETSIKINGKEFGKTIKGHSIENLLVTLQLGANSKKSTRALIRDVQIDPLKDTVIHVDFQEVSLEKKLRTKVRLEAMGEPAGVTQQGGVTAFTLREIEIECLPTNIPESVTFQVGHLNIGDAIYVRDIQAPVGVHILTHNDLSVFSVAAPKAEEVAKEAEVTEPEVIGKKKEGAEGTEGTEGEAGAEKKEPEGKKKEEAKEGEKKEEKKK